MSLRLPGFDEDGEVEYDPGEPMRIEIEIGPKLFSSIAGAGLTFLIGAVAICLTILIMGRP